MINEIRKFEKELGEYALDQMTYSKLHSYVTGKIVPWLNSSGYNLLDQYYLMDKVHLIFKLISLVGPYNHPVKMPQLLVLGTPSEAYILNGNIRRDYKLTATFVMDKFGKNVAELMPQYEFINTLHNIGVVDLYGISGASRHATFNEVFMHDLDVVHHISDFEWFAQNFFRDWRRMNHQIDPNNTDMMIDFCRRVLVRRYGKYGTNKIIVDEFREDNFFKEKINEVKEILDSNTKFGELLDL